MTYTELFRLIDEPYAAELFANEDRSLFYRHCAAQAAWFDAMIPVTYNGESLYPCGNAYLHSDRAVISHYAKTYEYRDGRMTEKLAASGLPEEDCHAALTAIRTYWEQHQFVGWLPPLWNFNRRDSRSNSSFIGCY
ncbi:MAG: hypothetical protein J5992_02795 [Oscillospiraceae bacterium]|nr:hypothetical protein [Oscillospiraceae bacterium]